MNYLCGRLLLITNSIILFYWQENCVNIGVIQDVVEWREEETGEDNIVLSGVANNEILLNIAHYIIV